VILISNNVILRHKRSDFISSRLQSIEFIVAILVRLHLYPLVSFILNSDGYVGEGKGSPPTANRPETCTDSRFGTFLDSDPFWHSRSAL
jgi:hypothetical protein